MIGQITCGLAPNKTGYIIEGFSGISANQLFTVEFNVENPKASSNYSIPVYSYSPQYEAKIDSGFGIIPIGTQCISTYQSP